jgi:AhpD family alkylhydroperoxidase
MRVSPRAEGSYPWYLRPFFRSQRRRYRQVLVPGLLWGRVPRLFVSVALLYGALDSARSALDPVLRSLVTVRISQLNWCRFCVDINSATLLKRAASVDKALALSGWRDSTLFSSLERAALDYAEAMTLSDRQVTDELVDRLRSFLDDDAIIELTGLIAFQNMSSKFNSALDVPAQGFCTLPGDGPSAR